MKDYTSADPVWSDTISIVEEDDLVNADNDTASAKQLLKNILVLQNTKVDKEEGKSLVSDTERTEWNAMYQQSTGYTDQKIADLIGGASSTLDTLGKIEKAMRENEDVVEVLDAAIGSKANQKEMESLLETKLDKMGDIKDNTITFGSSDTTTPSAWTDVDVLKSGETLKSFAQKVSTMFRNIRYLWKMMGNTDISAIGDGTVTGALSELNTGTELLNGTIITNSVTYAQNVVVNKITLSPGTWLITSHVSFTTSADAIYAHALLIGTMEGITVDGITVRNRMSGGGGTAIPYLVSVHDTTTITVIVNQSNPTVMTLESNVLRAVKL